MKKTLLFLGAIIFSGCVSLTEINFAGTKAQWTAVEKGHNWDYNTGDYTIRCTDGNIK